MIASGVLLLLRRRQSVRSGAMTIAVIATLSKVFGFIRELLIAWFFGASGLVDAYRIGETVNSLGAGLVSSSFDGAGLPLLVESGTRSGARAQDRLFASVLTAGALVAGLISIVTLAFAPLLVRLFAPRLAPPSLGLAVVATRVMVPVAFVTIITGALSAYYNARRRFTLPKLVDPVINVTAIVLLLFWARHSGVVALSAGWSIGHVLALGIALLPLILTGRRLLGTLRNPGVREFLRLAAPVLAAGAVRPLTVAAGRAFASFLPEGSIAMLGYADRLFGFPCYLLAASVATVFYTKAAELAASGRTDVLRRETGRLLMRLAVVLVPASAALAVLARPVVRLLYERGSFTPAATAGTASALALLAPGIFPFVVIAVLSAAFRARRRFGVPVRAALAGAASAIALNAVLVKPMGVAGLALASTVGLAVSAAILWLNFRKADA